MRREILLVNEMIAAAQRAQQLVGDVDLAVLEADDQRRDALLWNFTVLGEAAAQLDDQVKARFPEVEWLNPIRLRNRLIHGYWSIDWRSCTPPLSTSFQTLPSSSLRCLLHSRLPRPSANLRVRVARGRIHDGNRAVA